MVTPCNVGLWEWNDLIEANRIEITYEAETPSLPEEEDLLSFASDQVGTRQQADAEELT